ncbi:MAG: PEP-CTERM-box response regulator transcription factor [bacterium]
MHEHTILIIDDEKGMREQLRWGLQNDFRVLTASGGEQGLQLLRAERPDLVVLDLALSEGGSGDEGLDIFEQIQLIDARVKVIIITGNEQRDLAIKAVQMGAYDFYKKPIELLEFRIILKRALQLKKLEAEARVFQDEVEVAYNDEIIGRSPQMLQIFDIVDRSCETNATILINSESGTGKELIARAIHRKSPRREHPFVVVDCGAIPENLLESELFGHEKGAFTGAHVQRKGKFELADKGTIFLDEIGELNFPLQVKLLRFLQEHQVERVGGRQQLKLDVRILAATNRDLELEIERGNFRADLFYRLSVITISVPPLRERGNDIERLAEHFLAKFKTEYESEIRGFSTESKVLIREYGWPGNVRELENKVKRAVIMAQKPFIVPEDLNIGGSHRAAVSPLKNAVHEFEKNCILEALERNKGNISRTARELGVNRTTFYDMLNKYNIDKHVSSKSTHKVERQVQ